MIKFVSSRLEKCVSYLMDNERRIEMKQNKMISFLLTLIIAVGLLFVNQTDVNAASKKMSLNVTDIVLSVGQSRTLSVSNAKKVKWTSSKKSVVSVNSKGKITAKKTGKTTVTATVSGKKFKCNVVVSKPSSKKKDVLVVYFSQTGTTKAVAEKLQKLTGADLLRIREKNKYTSDYDKLTKVAKKELQDNARPEITTEARNIRSYDVIYVGYPVWWHSTPMVVNTFLEKYNLKGKTVIPFCTSGGSDIEETLSALKKSAKGAKFKEGYTADSGSTSEIKKWLTKIGELEMKTSSKTPTPTTSPEPSTLKPQTPSVTLQPPTPTTVPESSTDSKLLVAYFSWSGTSEKIAKNIIEQTGADSFRIEREVPYSTDYTETAYGDAQVEAETNARPAIKDPLPSVTQYDKIVLCYPIWWHTAPMTVGTFLESYDLTGKTIYPVSQSASMDVSQYEESVAFIKNCSKGATVDDGIFTKNNEQIQSYVNNTVMKDK